jgi:hypothetical protein
MNSTIFTPKEEAELRAFLLHHEASIGMGIDDFAELRAVFLRLIGRDVETVRTKL